ncbi:hypothetical protein [Streptomonospora litoralis]|uniref:DUF8129 domain-containing protein n=1 Tax=Streptomonospora litoralis TaxID=2498135 RepID=A0A4P6Q858_9ACTN|nr:hypothetical protein [Streptomonospora litoralis]QBI56600.1 hypothetical protein EKD16_24280 [Streptomonospora litoralis]
MSDAGKEPPIPGYEGLPIGSLQHRIRALPEDRLRDLIAYESSHADRTNVLELLRSRLSELENGAEPTGGDQTFHPETPEAPRGGSAVSEGGQGPRPKGDYQPGSA